VIGEAYAPNPAEPNKLKVAFPTNIFGYQFNFNEGDYHVWATDYTNYSLVYSCKIFLGVVKYEAAWFLSRTKTLSDADLNNLKSIIAQKNVDYSNFISVPQNCPN
jgi:lipocalin